MDYCPNCGEPVDDEATFCQHCGSDAETGWKADVDYYTVDLPEDEEVERPRPQEDARRKARLMLGHAAMALCLVLFTSVGYSRYGFGIIIPAVFLMGMTLLGLKIFLRSQPRPGR